MLYFSFSALDDPTKEQEFETYFNKYQKQIVAFVFRMIQDQFDAEDVALAAFEKVSRCFSKVCMMPKQRALNFVYKIAKNESLDYLRKKSKQPCLVSIEDFYNISYEEAFDAFEDDLLYKKAVSIILSLPPKTRDILSLHLIDGFNSYQIAKLYNMSRNTVKSTIYRNKKIILKRMKEGEKNDKT